MTQTALQEASVRQARLSAKVAMRGNTRAWESLATSAQRESSVAPARMSALIVVVVTTRPLAPSNAQLAKAAKKAHRAWTLARVARLESSVLLAQLHAKRAIQVSRVSVGLPNAPSAKEVGTPRQATMRASIATQASSARQVQPPVHPLAKPAPMRALEQRNASSAQRELTLSPEPRRA